MGPERAPAAADDARPRHVAGLHRPRHVRLRHLGRLQGQPGATREAPHCKGAGGDHRSRCGSELKKITFEDECLVALRSSVTDLMSTSLIAILVSPAQAYYLLLEGEAVSWAQTEE